MPQELSRNNPEKPRFYLANTLENEDNIDYRKTNEGWHLACTHEVEYYANDVRSLVYDWYIVVLDSGTVVLINGFYIFSKSDLAQLWDLISNFTVHLIVEFEAIKLCTIQKRISDMDIRIQQVTAATAQHSSVKPSKPTIKYSPDKNQ